MNDLLRLVVQRVEQDIRVQEDIKRDPVAAIQKVTQDVSEEYPIYFRDKWLYRLAISALSLVVIGVVVGAFILAGIERDIPDVVVALGSAAIGGVVALFAPSPLQNT